MLSPSEARARILERIPARAADDDHLEHVPIVEAAGRFLARDAVSDVDLPPFEKSMMDGYALRASDCAADGTELECVGESRAGEPFSGAVPPGACIEIYTGAELPSECDAVEMIERTERVDGGRVRFGRAVAPEQNVSHVGEILGEGRAAITAPRRLTAADLSVLASIGYAEVPVARRLRVSVLTTGDELVPVAEKPGRGQIREGNTLFLAAACRALGCDVRRAGIVPDESSALEAAFAEALDDGDVLITTGGVSVGKYDLVGATFERLGVEPVLHKVAIKPGKPIWFGIRERDGVTKPVFGLPGNPVSTLLGFEVFVRPALLRMAGAGPDAEVERVRRGRWTGPPRRAAERQVNVPATRVHAADGVVELAPLAFRGSADIVSTARADALVIVPAGGGIEPGALVDYRPLSVFD